MSSDVETLETFTSEADAEFVNSLNNFIDNELKILKLKRSNASLDDYNRERGTFPSQERFQIFRQAFNKLLGYVQVYKNILTNIKNEYESVIDLLESKKIDREFARHEMIKLKKKSFTIINLEQRKVELETK